MVVPVAQGGADPKRPILNRHEPNLIVLFLLHLVLVGLDI
jgi:hypothetical protein